MSALSEILQREFFGIKLGLDSMRVLCGVLGEPQRAAPCALVAGTNGKGSVTAMAATAIQAAGYSVGRYTSPHLVSLRERFVVDGTPVDEATIEAAGAAVLEAEAAGRASGAISAPMTFFELTTATAFEVFRRLSVEAVVYEVGLGGRFDATNVVSPAVCAITTIGLDHVVHLGDTLAAIAFEKAGIAREGVPLVTGALPPEAGEVVMRVAAERGAPVVEAHAGGRRAASIGGDGRTVLDLATPVRDYGPVTLALRGRHQVDNAVVATRLVEEFARITGLAIGRDAVAAGLGRARWPGRLDLRATPDGREVLLDAAHNPEGAASLAEYLSESGLAPLPIVFGVMRDKDAAPMLRALAPVATRFVFTQASTSRARNAADLPALASAAGVDVPAVIAPAPVTAVREALRDAPRACVAGSIFLVGDVLRWCLPDDGPA